MMLGSKRKNSSTQAKVVDPDIVAKALAKAVRTGNIVDFRFLFLPFSPAREDSTERFDMPRYEYLLPDVDMERDREFQQILEAVRGGKTWEHIQGELRAKRPAQLPSDLLLMLADNAVRTGKYTSAAQAYELLRIRPRMQEEFYAEADRALDANDIDRGVRGYLIATGLEYDYAAFPEPLPEVADFQTRALMLHGEFPERPEDCLAMQEDDTFIRTALEYMLTNPTAAARLESRSPEVRRAFLRELVNRRDPGWKEFTERWREARDLAVRFHENRARLAQESENSSRRSALAEELKAELGDDPRQIPARLLGREIPEGEWWQYLKDLAYEHPAAALFVCRYLMGDTEILIPVCRPDSFVPVELGLLPGS